MSNYLLRYCPDHGTTTVPDRDTAEMFLPIVRDCVEYSSQDAREHASDHTYNETDCYACCPRMLVPDAPITCVDWALEQYRDARHYAAATASNVIGAMTILESDGHDEEALARMARALIRDLRDPVDRVNRTRDDYYGSVHW